MKLNKHLIWVVGLIFIFLIICGTLIYLNQNPYILRLEMDNNTLEAVKSINWSGLI